MCMSDPKHFDTILPFLQPLDVPHRIDLTIDSIESIHTHLRRGMMLNVFILVLIFIRGLVVLLVLLMFRS
jgi:hypothetical protein